MKNVILFAFTALLFSGCATITVTRAGNRTTADIQNTSWYLFCLIPIASGDPEVPNRLLCTWFKDRADPAGNIEMLRDLCRREAAGPINIETRYRDEKIAFVLLKRIACNTSAELIQD